MDGIRDIEVVVFDVLGTLVDESSGLRAAIRDALPGSDDASDASVDELLALGTCAELGRGACEPPTSTGRSGIRPRAPMPSTCGSADWMSWSPR